MRIQDYYWCETCGVRTTIKYCKLCGGTPAYGGNYLDRFDRLFHLELVLRLDLWSISREELDRILDRLVPCPLCQGDGIVQPPERDTWAECPVCWGAMYATPTCQDPFDPVKMPPWYDIAMPALFGMNRNRLRDGLK